MKQCKCGGQIDIAELTSGATRWKCRSCGRYEVNQKPQQAIEKLSDHELDVLDMVFERFEKGQSVTAGVLGVTETELESAIAFINDVMGYEVQHDFLIKH